jgi:hypothetical protein
MKYVISGNRAYVSINDEITVIQKDSDPRFHEILAAIRNDDEAEVRRLILEGEVKLGKLKVSRKGVKFDTKTLHPAFAKAYLYAAEADKSAIELFFKNVAENPNKDSQADLANFLLRNALPITDRGTFLAYRYVNAEFYDCHTGTMDNMIGNSVEMARENCDSDREVTCSRGLHVCHYSYLANNGTTHLVVEINPRDVVAVPTDYNGAKMRVCRFRVLSTVDHFASKLGAFADPLQTVPFVQMAGFDTPEVAESIPAELVHRYKPVDGGVWAAS